MVSILICWLDETWVRAASLLAGLGAVRLVFGFALGLGDGEGREGVT